MGRLRRSRVHKNIKDFKKKCRTRKRTKDLDQIHEDLKEVNLTKIQIKAGVKDVDDLPGGGQYYCIHCALVLSAICDGYGLSFPTIVNRLRYNYYDVKNSFLAYFYSHNFCYLHIQAID